MNIIKQLFLENRYKTQPEKTNPLQYFSLPREEEVAAQVFCTVSVYAKDHSLLTASSGLVWVTTSFLCFLSEDSALCFAFPLFALCQLERAKTTSNIYVFHATTLHEQHLELFVQEQRHLCELFCDRLLTQLRKAMPDVQGIHNFLRPLLSERLCYGLTGNGEYEDREQEQRTMSHAARSDASSATKSSKDTAAPPLPLHTPASSTVSSSTSAASSLTSSTSASSFSSWKSPGLGAQFGYPDGLSTASSLASLKMKHWQSYFQALGTNFTLLRTAQLRQLVRSGVPNELRGELWETLSCSLYVRWKCSKFYNQWLKKLEDPAVDRDDEIEKDLERSLPGYSGYHHAQGIDSLRRVLTVHAAANADMGYCQANNIVVAALLVYCTEEQAYFLFSQLSKYYIPGYYSKIIYGVLLDLNVFTYLLEHTLPHVHKHLADIDIDLKLLTLNWFLTLYIKVFRLDLAAQVLDCLFMSGPCVLFQLALALFKITASRLLEAQDDSYVVAAFQTCFDSINSFPVGFSHTISVDKDDTSDPTKSISDSSSSSADNCSFEQLLSTAFETFGYVTNDLIHSKRSELKASVLSSIHGFTKRTHLRGIYEQILLSRTELDFIYDSFVQALGEDQICHSNVLEQCIDYEHYMKMIEFNADWFRNNSPYETANDTLAKRQLCLRLFYWMRDGNGTYLSFKNLVIGVERLKVDCVLHSAMLVFYLYDTKKRGFLDKEDIIELSETLIFMCCKTNTSRDDIYLTTISKFLHLCFSGFREQNAAFALSCDAFQKVVEQSNLRDVLVLFLQQITQGFLSDENKEDVFFNRNTN
ncbi:GTPase activating protein Gyp2 [Schizosaccharomyces japonicus yFS275]|uniref:GTPase activating protein Gyp2 n=1 Tax=Schizosaccharomyces japonicus (strain yFS275 / FY16936) TaxID=402676 RepID=B6JWT9_SCHJY|nr:GTPase activating protein Gyp2 [Schizosaccharomyces japonicus yFS275]EEB05840.1 GTPase activating protein Gyp2 [Schizosaccharomyces japonicus yFS275]